MEEKGTERFRPLLDARLAEVDARLAAVRDELGEVRGARAGSTSDDEHDPEGSTLSSDWSRVEGLLRSALGQRAAIERAVDRMDTGSYGACVRCGAPIGVARLLARPEAEHCIDCARELEHVIRRG